MTATITAPGIYLDFPEADYFADPTPNPSLTQSIAKVLLDRSPAHARLEHPRLAPPAAEDEPAEKYVVAQAIGNAAHKLLTGRGRDVAALDFPNFVKGDAKDARDKAMAAGKLVILAKHNARAVALVAAAREQLDAIDDEALAGSCFDAFRTGHGEVVIAAQDQHGFWCRSLIDWMCSTTALWDLKTTAKSAAPWNADKNMVDGGWPIQAAMQDFILNQIDPDNAGRRKFRFANIENDEPYAMTVCEITEASMTMGRKHLDYAMPLWRKCLATKHWPAYPPEIIRPEYPGWQESRWLEREIKEAARDRLPSRREPMLTDLSGG